MQIKESNTLDNKHREMVKQFSKIKNEKDNILQELKDIKLKLESINNNKQDIDYITLKAELLDKKDNLENKLKSIEKISFIGYEGENVSNEILNSNKINLIKIKQILKKNYFLLNGILQ